MERMVEHGLLERRDSEELGEAWTLASQIRSALALFGAHSTDVLPTDRVGLEGAARLMGYPSGSASELEDRYLRVTRRSRVVFERVFYGKSAGGLGG